MGKTLAFVNMVGFVMQLNLKKPKQPQTRYWCQQSICLQTDLQERSDGQNSSAGKHRQPQLDLASPFNCVLHGFFLSPSNSVKCKNRSDNG